MEYLGKDIPKLGFGLMRLPMLGEEVDLEQTKQMVDKFLARPASPTLTRPTATWGARSEDGRQDRFGGPVPPGELPAGDQAARLGRGPRPPSEAKEHAGTPRCGAPVPGISTSTCCTTCGDDRTQAFDQLRHLGLPAPGDEATKGLHQARGLLLPRQGRRAGRAAHQAPGDGVRPAANQLRGLGGRQRPVPPVLRGGPQAQQAGYHHGACQGRPAGAIPPRRWPRC